MQTITSRQDLTAYVTDTLQGHAADHDVEAIVDAMQAAHDNDNADAVAWADGDSDAYWALVSEHAR